jgi:hypothetical protein
MVTVANEVKLSHLHQVDRWERLPPPRGGGDLLPATAGTARGGTEAAIEVAAAADRADDLIERDHLKTHRALADKAEGLDHLLVGEDDADVVGLAPQARDQLRDRGSPARTDEIVLRIQPG